MHLDHVESDMLRVFDLLTRHLSIVHFPAYPADFVWGFFCSRHSCALLTPWIVSISYLSFITSLFSAVLILEMVLIALAYVIAVEICQYKDMLSPTSLLALTTHSLLRASPPPPIASSARSHVLEST